MVNCHNNRCNSCGAAEAVSPAVVPTATNTSFEVEAASAGCSCGQPAPPCVCNCCCNCCCDSDVDAEMEENCRQQMANCKSVCFVDNRNCPGGCTGRPVAIVPPQNAETIYERCCDPSGCCGLFPRCCRNPFWPSFAKPTWLCCRDLYKM